MDKFSVIVEIADQPNDLTLQVSKADSLWDLKYRIIQESQKNIKELLNFALIQRGNYLDDYRTIEFYNIQPNVRDLIKGLGKAAF